MTDKLPVGCVMCEMDGGSCNDKVVEKQESTRDVEARSPVGKPTDSGEASWTGPRQMQSPCG